MAVKGITPTQVMAYRNLSILKYIFSKDIFLKDLESYTKSVLLKFKSLVKLLEEICLSIDQAIVLIAPDKIQIELTVKRTFVKHMHA